MPADIGEPQFSRTQRTNGAERVERMLDAKTRMIGVDTKALDIQVNPDSLQPGMFLTPGVSVTI